MTAFDFIVLLIVGVTAAGGFMRGFVQEILSLASWIVAVLALRFLHTDLTAAIHAFTGGPISAALLAFSLLLLIPYGAMRLIASRAGKTARASVLGPIDRVLGFGFGAVKGVIVVVMAFSLLVLGYDAVWGPSGRPLWISTARTYPFVNASSEAMIQLIEQRRAYAHGEAEQSVDGHN
jgi:membrane protein required for colicin V production